MHSTRWEVEESLRELPSPDTMYSLSNDVKDVVVIRVESNATTNYDSPKNASLYDAPLLLDVGHNVACNSHTPEE
jgi:hypothetical protein